MKFSAGICYLYQAYARIHAVTHTYSLHITGFRMNTKRHYCNKCGLKNNKCECEELK